MDDERLDADLRRLFHAPAERLAEPAAPESLFRFADGLREPPAARRRLFGRLAARRSVALVGAAAVVALALGTATLIGGGAGPAGPGNAVDPTAGPCGEVYAERLSDRRFDTVGVHPAVAEPSSACATPAPIATGGPWIGARRAADAFRAFTGRSGRMQVEGPYDTAYGPEYRVATPDASSTYIAGGVNAASGEVTSYYWQPRVVDFTTPTITKDEARSRAAAFLAEHRIDTEGLTVSVDTGTLNAYAVTWERLEAGVGVMPRIVVGVDWQTGGIEMFLSYRHAYAAPPAPAISREQAAAKAIEMTTRDPGGPPPVVESARLRISFWWDGSQHLDWIVTVSGTESDGRPWFAAEQIDAMTGELD